MVSQARKDGTEGHIVNTASMAGYVTGMMGAYSTSKHSCVAVTEGLLQDLRIAKIFPTVATSVLCPGFVQTNIFDQSKYVQSGAAPPAANVAKAFAKMPGSIPTSEVADMVFEAIHKQDLYINTHPQSVQEAVRSRAEGIIK